MSKQLNNNQINYIQTLTDAGDYDIACRYIAEQIETNVQDGTVTRETQKWFEWAEQVNGNQGAVVDKYARTFAQISFR